MGEIRAKGKCCKSEPRCKKCPVVLNRLAKEGYAERLGKRRYLLSKNLAKKVLKAARR